MSYQVIPILNPKYNMVRGASKRINSLPAEARPACISHYNILHPFPSQFTPLSLRLAAAAEDVCNNNKKIPGALHRERRQCISLGWKKRELCSRGVETESPQPKCSDFPLSGVWWNRNPAQSCSSQLERTIKHEPPRCLVNRELSV